MTQNRTPPTSSWLICAALAALAAASPPPAAAKSAAPAGLTGLWLLNQDVYDKGEDRTPPLKPEYVAAAEKQRNAQQNGGQVLSNAGKLCLPIGMPGLVTNEFALKFLETPGEVTVVSENSPLVRTIYLNRKKNETDQDPSWNGHSIGHWQDKTLVVDTISLNDRVSHIPGVRGVTSLTTHITERYHIENGGKTLVNAMTFEDPNVLSHPWTVTYRYHRADPGSELWEYVCEVNTEGWSERFPGDPAFKGDKPAAPAAP